MIKVLIAGIWNYIGTTAEMPTLPDTALPVPLIYRDTDTGIESVTYGTSWLTVRSGGAAYTAVQSQPPAPGNQRFSSSTDFSATGVAAWNSPALGLYGAITVNISSLTGGTISLNAVLGSSANVVSTSAIAPIDVSTGTVVSSTALASGTYVIKDVPMALLQATPQSTVTAFTLTMDWTR